MRRLLARYGEPRLLEPPPDLAGRVIDSLARPPASTSRLRPISTALILLATLVLFALGAWGVLVDSSAPAGLFGDMRSGLSQLLLVLTLTAKPLINLLLTAGMFALLILAAIIAGGWLWWRLLRRELALGLEARA